MFDVLNPTNVLIQVIENDQVICVKTAVNIFLTLSPKDARALIQKIDSLKRESGQTLNLGKANYRDTEKIKCFFQKHNYNAKLVLGYQCSNYIFPYEAISTASSNVICIMGKNFNGLNKAIEHIEDIQDKNENYLNILLREITTKELSVNEMGTLKTKKAIIEDLIYRFENTKFDY